MFDEKDLKMAEKSISSTIHKNEKAMNSLINKNRYSQVKLVENQIRVHKVMLKMIRNELYEVNEEICKEALKETFEAVLVFEEKIEKIMPKLKAGTSSHTLSVRRLKSYDMVKTLIEEKL